MMWQLAADVPQESINCIIAPLNIKNKQFKLLLCRIMITIIVITRNYRQE